MILLRVLYHSWIQRLEVVFWVQTADRTEAGELYLMTNTVYHYPSTICGYNSHNTRSYAHTAAAYSADDHCCVAPPKIKAPKITASQQRSPLVLLVFFSFFFLPLSYYFLFFQRSHYHRHCSSFPSFSTLLLCLDCLVPEFVDCSWRLLSIPGLISEALLLLLLPVSPSLPYRSKRAIFLTVSCSWRPSPLSSAAIFEIYWRH